MAQPLIAGINLQSLLRQISQAKNSALSCLGTKVPGWKAYPRKHYATTNASVYCYARSIIINANA